MDSEENNRIALLAIKPKYIRSIICGEKKVEFRPEEGSTRGTLDDSKAHRCIRQKRDGKLHREYELSMGEV